MKWTNRGHELDALATRCLAVTHIYIWEVGDRVPNRARTCIDFLRYLKIDRDFTICFVDENSDKQANGFCGLEVISPDELFAQYNEKSVVVATRDAVRTILEERGLWYFNWIKKYNSRRNFIQHFLSVYMLYKYDRLISYSMNYNVTTVCNLNCRGCLNFNHFIHSPKDETFDQFRRHMDIVFQKFDCTYEFEMTGGEPFLNKELPVILCWFASTYGERIFERHVVTNGTIMPSDELLSAMRDGGYTVLIDDYRHTVPLEEKQFPQIIKKFENWGIAYSINSHTQWFDLAVHTADFSHLDEAGLIAHRDGCNIYLSQLINGRVYSCCYENYARVAGVVDHADSIDIATTPKVELLEYRLGYTKKGYLDMCTHCYGLGNDSICQAAAMQIPKSRLLKEEGKTS